jgi:hypothetical protein
MTNIKLGLAGSVALLCALFFASSASATFGLKPGTVDASALDQNGESFTQAGAHPFSVSTTFELNTMPSPRPEEAQHGLEVSSESPLREVKVEAPPGLAGNPTATPRCTMAEFLNTSAGTENPFSACRDSTQIGNAITHMNYFSAETHWESPIDNLVPQEGQPALFGFKVVYVPVFAVPSLRSEGDYGFDFNVLDIDRTMPVLGNKFTLWGVPASPSHDDERGESNIGSPQGVPCASDHSKLRPCPSEAPEKAFLTAPTDCAHGPFFLRTEVRAWGGQSDSAPFVTHDNEGNPMGVTRCDRVPFEPSISATPTTENAETASGLDVELQMPDAGILNPEGLAQSNLEEAVVKLPEGVTVNPSAAEGLGVCSKEDYAREKLDTPPGEGCPNASKIGTVQIQSPLLQEGELVSGSLFLAQGDDPTTREAGAENPFDSLLALYIVAKLPERGVMVKLAGKVEPDKQTGQITTTFADLPQLSFSSFKLHFREGARAPLVSAPTCGQHATEAQLTPSSAPDQSVFLTSVSLITRGVGGGPCPSGGVAPFHPDFAAGSVNNNAKSFSPFDMYLTRQDGEQDMTKFSSELPPGVLGTLRGVTRCPNKAVSIAKSKTGRQELASPSCPADSEIGHIMAAAGVGSVLTHVGGKVYLGGRYKGDPLSVIVITPAVAGPFDVGTVVTREALTLNPETAEVQVDGSKSDPIPHILKGIPLKVRELWVEVDRPHFILNPTSCDPSKAHATLFGSYLDVFSPLDDRPFGMAARYQAANCKNLGFKPKLQISLHGGSNRGDHPALKAVLKARPRDANIGGATVTLPSSAFLDQAHIRTICTRVQFAAKQCPPGSEYGYARAWTPLLDEVIEGPVYLRSSSHKLPDLVAHLNGIVDVDVVGRIDSFKGGLRSSFERIPDAPVSRFVLNMQGGERGLVVNSRNLCAAKNRANVRFVGQNGKPDNYRPVVEPSGCGGKRKR